MNYETSNFDDVFPKYFPVEAQEGIGVPEAQCKQSTHGSPSSSYLRRRLGIMGL
jgi:hypothetical protein